MTGAMIVLPRQMTAAEYVRCVAIAGAIVGSRKPVVEIDASRLHFIDPFALTLLAAACERVGQDGRRVEIIALHPQHGGYLDRMDLFRQKWISCERAQIERQKRDGRGGFVELKMVTTAAEVDTTANALTDAVLGRVPNLEKHAPRDEMTCVNDWDRATEPLGHAFTELLQNALTHARGHGYHRANVWVTAQYLKSQDVIHIGIVDTGCGFLRSLERHRDLVSQTDEAAILLALRPRVSCNRGVGIMGDAVNAGIGLTTTYRIVRAAEGRMLIVSGSGAVQVAGDSDAVGAVSARPWQGAGLALQLSRSAMMRVNVSELMPPRDIGRPAPGLRFE